MRALMAPGGMLEMRRELDRLFDRFWDKDEVAELPMTGEWNPRLDFKETKSDFVLKLEIPGIEPKDVTVTFQDHTLTVKGEKQQEREDKDERFYRMERGFGAFVRTIRLPVPVLGDKVRATFRNGLLTVVLPKAPATKGAEVPVTIE